MKIISGTHSDPRRRGAALVEFSVILPVLLALLIGSIEIGRGISVRRRCAEAARSGARVYSMRKTKSEADVRAMVAQIMAESGLKKYTVTLSPTPSPSIKQLDPLKVTVSVNASDASWVPSPWFLKGTTKISSTCAMPADLGEAAGDSVSTPSVVNTPTLVDDDPEAEGSGVTQKELQDLEKTALDLVKKARDERANADKKQQEANDTAVKEQQDADAAIAKKQQEADDAAAKAALTGKSKDIQDAAKKQQEADAFAIKTQQDADAAIAKKQQEANDAAAKALAMEQLARDALQALTNATAGYSQP